MSNLQLTTTDDRECPKPENTVPTQSVKSMQRTSRSQKYFHSLDMINNDLHVKTAIRVALLAFPLLLRNGPSCSSKCMCICEADEDNQS